MGNLGKNLGGGGAASPRQGRWDPASLRPVFLFKEMRSKMFLAMFTVVWMNIAPPQGLNITPGARVLWAGLMRPQIILQLCLTFCDPMDCSLPGSSVHGILQARTLEWVVISAFWGSPKPRAQTHVSCIGRQFFIV